jgi:hypothetical protein
LVGRRTMPDLRHFRPQFQRRSAESNCPFC